MKLKASPPRIYLDNAASSPPFPEIATDALHRVYFANPSAVHRLAFDIRQDLKAAAHAVLDGLGIARESAVVRWTSGGTEANNLAIHGTVAASANATAVTSLAEHPSVSEPLASSYATVRKATVTSDGRVSLTNLSSLLAEDVRLLSICQVQSDTGAVNDLVAIRALMEERAPRALLHVDATQGAGKLPISWAEAKIDLLTISSHKLHGPGGVGALIVRQGVEVNPQVQGGGQQDNVRSGSLDACGIVAFAQAVELTVERRASVDIEALRAQLLDGLATLVDRRGHPLKTIVNSPADGSPFITNVSISGHEGAILARFLSEEGIMVGTGSACSAESKEPSKVLTAMGRNRADAFASVRVSFGYQNTAADVAGFLDALQQAIRDY